MSSETELKRLRKAQAREVMPVIGPLLDAWEAVPNDFRFEMESQASELVGYLEAISDAMENAT